MAKKKDPPYQVSVVSWYDKHGNIQSNSGPSPFTVDKRGGGGCNFCLLNLSLMVTTVAFVTVKVYRWSRGIG